MGDENLRKAFKAIRDEAPSMEEAYEKYAVLVDEKVNRNTHGEPTHVVTWTNKHGLNGRIDKITRLLIAIVPRQSARAKAFGFKTYHVLDQVTTEHIEVAVHKASAFETLSSFMAGIFAWLFFLSLPLVPVVGLTFLTLTGVSFFGFWGSIYSLSNARYRNLPGEFKDISADYWAIQTLTKVNSNSE